MIDMINFFRIAFTALHFLRFDNSIEVQPTLRLSKLFLSSVENGGSPMPGVFVPLSGIFVQCQNAVHSGFALRIDL